MYLSLIALNFLCIFHLPFAPSIFPNPALPYRSSPTAEVFQISDDETIILDGRLTEVSWLEAKSIGSLVMVEPKEGAPSTEKTDIRILANSTAIYIGIHCYDGHNQRVSYAMNRDANLEGEDHIKFVFDTFLNGRTGYVFAINPHGARYDALVPSSGEDEDDKWDCIWNAEVKIHSKGWSAEIRIPIKSLRFKQGLAQWGFNIERRVQRLQETDRWASPIRNYDITHLSQSGRLQGLPEFKLGLGLKIRPYSLGNFINNNLDVPQQDKIQTGIDILKSFGGNVTGILSVNTDFAETEVDTKQTNLTRFPLFFPEKRTFFLEGSDIFDFGYGLRIVGEWDLLPFFSRRIGLAEKQTVPLDLATKVIGNIDNFNFGMLDVLTQPTEGIAPRTNLFVARGFQNLWKESKLGFLITGGDPLGYSGGKLFGLDFTYKTTRFLGNKNFIIGIWGLYSHRKIIQGDSSSFGFKVDFPNDLWDTYLSLKRIGDAFDPPIGFVPWKGIYKLDYGLKYNPRPQWPWLRQMFHEFRISVVNNLDGQLLKWKFFISPLSWRLESGDNIGFNITPQGEDLPESFYLTPEVVVSERKYNWTRYSIEYESADKRRIKTKLGYNFGELYNGNFKQYLMGFNWRCSRNLNLSFEGESGRGRLPSGPVDIQLARARVDAFLTPDFQINSFIQYDNLTRSLGMNMRLRWTYRSLLDIFVVYNRNWFETQGAFRPQVNQLIIKIQYAWCR